MGIGYFKMTWIASGHHQWLHMALAAIQPNEHKRDCNESFWLVPGTIEE